MLFKRSVIIMPGGRPRSWPFAAVCKRLVVIGAPSGDHGRTATVRPAKMSLTGPLVTATSRRYPATVGSGGPSPRGSPRDDRLALGRQLNQASGSAHE